MTRNDTTDRGRRAAAGLAALAWAVALAAWSAAPARASFKAGDVGTSGANFLKLGVGARAAAMGGAVSASVADPTAMRWNPAGLARIRQYTVSTMHASYLGLATYQHLGFAAPLPKPYGVAALDLTYVSVGSIGGTDAAGADLGAFHPYNMALGLGYAHSLGRLQAGGALRFIQSKILGSASTVALDLGTQLRATKHVQLALALQNLGPGLKFESEQDPLPTTVRAGGVLLASSECLLALDLSWPRDNQPTLHAGLEYRLYRGERVWVMGRLGYSSQTLHVRGFSGPSFGLGLPVSFGSNRLTIDYALSPTGELGTTHHVSLQYSWGGSAAGGGGRR